MNWKQAVVSAMLLGLVILVQGCATTRTVTVRDTDRVARVTHGGDDDDQVRIGFWRALWEPWVEEQSTRVAEESWRRQEGSVYHGKALEAAEATRLTEPFVEAPVTVQPFDEPLNPKPIGENGEEFSRYEEEPADDSLADVGSAATADRVRVRQAMGGGTMELPLAAQEGGRPVVLINDSRYRAKQFIVRRDRGPSYEINVAPGQRAVRYLQLGRHLVEVYDQNGRPQKIRDPRREVYKRSYSYRWRDRSWDYTGSFVVNSVPSFVDENGQQFFGVFRSY